MKPQAPSDNETPKVPSIKVPAPSTPQQSQSNAQNNDNAAGANGGGFNAGERTTVSEPAPQAGTATVSYTHLTSLGTSSSIVGA